MFVLVAYFGMWDSWIKLLGVFSTKELAEAAQVEFEKKVNSYLALNPFPGKEDFDDDEQEKIYNQWKYLNPDCYLIDYDGSRIFEFELDKMNHNLK